MDTLVWWGSAVLMGLALGWIAQVIGQLVHRPILRACRRLARGPLCECGRRRWWNRALNGWACRHGRSHFDGDVEAPF